MTEKKAQEIIELLMLNGKKSDHIKNGERVVYLSDAISIVREALMTDQQKTFAVGEYYATDNGDIYKITSQEKLLITIKMYSKSSGRFLDMTIPSHDPQDKPATTEQIATFKRAEQFAKHGREWSEFKKGDTVLNNHTDRIGIVESVDDDGDVVVNYNQEGPLSFRDYKCAGALYLDLIQTAEELQEVN